MTAHWLMKAEPDSRVEKGKDVKFSVDDFEAARTTAWEGVRNGEAKNLMKEMKVGDKVLFYHSNCKEPGIAGFAEVSKEAFPDYTAWDKEHPYYDPKTDPEKPKWMMVELTFSKRAQHFIPLALIRYIADNSSPSPPEELKYIDEAGVGLIKAMSLITRPRLSVQRVEEGMYGVAELLAEKGGWEEMDYKKRKGKNKKNKKERQEDGVDSEQDSQDGDKAAKSGSSTRKRKANSNVDEIELEQPPRRRSTRKK